MIEHTPTPWVVVQDYFIREIDNNPVAQVSVRASAADNAAFIVLACNAHNDLVAFAEAMLGYMLPLELAAMRDAALAKVRKEA